MLYFFSIYFLTLNYLSIHRQIPPIPPAIVNKNGIFNQNNTNGYTNRNNLSNHSSPVANTSRQQYIRSYQPNQLQYLPHQYQLTSQLYQHQPNVFQMQHDMQRIDENVIRLPRGPEGPGFMFKR